MILNGLSCDYTKSRAAFEATLDTLKDWLAIQRKPLWSREEIDTILEQVRRHFRPEGE